MTLLLAYAHDTGVILASDKLELSGWYKRYLADGKWFKLGAWWLAVSGHGLAEQALKFGTGEPVPKGISGLTPWMRKCLDTHGCGPHKDEEGVSTYPCRMIAVSRRGVWEIDSRLGAHKISAGEWAISGSGQDLARGVIEALSVHLSPVELAQKAITIAQEQNASVDGCHIQTVFYEGMDADDRAAKQRDFVNEMVVPD